ncbi:hypothetical protein IFM89_013197 [Coptis chinensis]|uniref:Reverse transcriptase zinc-binding domain-containing protein n=1 Tax=Coptis chinensis TaxID=261450 RepID=A0A835HUJ7_9MAGN|nr:hypothetical protein IFM89_013197 [Coptis chinensis]
MRGMKVWVYNGGQVVDSLEMQLNEMTRLKLFNWIREVIECPSDENVTICSPRRWARSYLCGLYARSDRDSPTKNSTNQPRRVWKEDLKGNFSVSSAFQAIRRKNTTVDWQQQVWNEYVHPRTAGTAWKLCQKCAATDAAMQRRGLQMASKCYLGCQAEENLQHIIWDCRFAKDLWEWVAWQFGFRGFTNLKEAISRCNHRSTIIVHL